LSDAFKDDPWISSNSQIAPQKLHALGVMNYRWNIADASLKSMLVQLSKADFSTIWAIIHEMGDIAIASAITEILISSNAPKPIKDAIAHGLKVYERNRINRNQLTHFLPTSLVGSDLARLKGPRFDPQPLPDDIGDLRRVADEIGGLLTYFGKLLSVIASRQYSLKLGGSFLQLPDTIPLPELLVSLHPQKRPEQHGEPEEDGAGNRPPSVLRLTEEEWIAKYRKEGRPFP
jgi:hypothetical protein